MKWAKVTLCVEMTIGRGERGPLEQLGGQRGHFAALA